MTRRVKNNLKMVSFFAIVLILVIMAVQTIWVGFNLALYSNDIVESNGSVAVYEGANAGRAQFYNSSNSYIRWLSNLDNVYRLPFGMLIVLSPVLYIFALRKYNMNKRIKRARIN